jgi:hypothetical protein
MTPKKNRTHSTAKPKNTQSAPTKKPTPWQPPYTPPLSLNPIPTPRVKALRGRVNQRRFASVVGPAVTGDRTVFGLPSPKEFVPVPKRPSQQSQRKLLMPAPMVPKNSPSLNVGRKLKVLGPNQRPLDDKPFSHDLFKVAMPDIPPMGLVISFIEEAEELADGKRQEGLMEEVVKQFGTYLLYVDALETKTKNLREAYSNLLDAKRMAPYECT